MYVCMYIVYIQWRSEGQQGTGHVAFGRSRIWFKDPHVYTRDSVCEALFVRVPFRVYMYILSVYIDVSVCMCDVYRPPGPSRRWLALAYAELHGTLNIYVLCIWVLCINIHIYWIFAYLLISLCRYPSVSFIWPLFSPSESSYL